MEDLHVESVKATGILDNHTPRSWNQKETVHEAYGIAVVNGKIVRCARAIWYMGHSRDASTVYCALSANNAVLSPHGHGQAGGGGYCKTSASLDEAIRSAGIELSRSVHGTGQSRQAIEAIVKYLYPDATDVSVLIS